MFSGLRRRPAAGHHVLLLLGLVGQAGTTYAFLILAGRSLGDVQFGAMSGLYILVTSVATGLFQPLEQEVTRRRGRERVLHTRDPALLRRALVAGMAAAAVGAAVSLLLFPVTVKVLGDDARLVPILCVALPAYAVWFAARGELAGAGRLGRYGAQLALDGTVRLGAGVVLVATGLATTVTLSVLFALSPWVAVVLTLPRRSGDGEPLASRPRTTHESLARPYVLLLVSALAAQLLMNAGPVVIGLLASRSERGEVGVFLAALVLIRVPVFLFTAVQPGFLPLLAARAAADDPAGFRRVLVTVTTALLALVGTSCLVVVALGPPVVHLLFSFDHGLPRLVYLLLTLAIGMFLVSTVLAQALVALGRHSHVTVGWLAGLVGLAVGTQLGHRAVDRATNGLLAGGLVACIVIAAAVARAMHGWRAVHRPDRVVVGSR